MSKHLFYPGGAIVGGEGQYEGRRCPRAGGLYPAEKKATVVGPLPYTLEQGVGETVEWMRGRGLIRPSKIPS